MSEEKTEPVVEEQPDWEKVRRGVLRLAVPGGWIYAIDNNDETGESTVFVPTPAET